MARFKIDDEVILKANAEENWPKEYGIVTTVQDQNKYPGMYIVQITETPLEMEDSDDGIREIHEDNITLRFQPGERLMEWCREFMADRGQQKARVK